ncbi:hypothetical protein BBJ28_00014148 [Nothophytophthora sp. Chile5]|nr:hypothetical protein BBJ28_00014148 [Nothophytophthora sp. Chile5]
MVDQQRTEGKPLGERQLTTTTSAALSSVAVSASDVLAAHTPSVEESMKLTGGVVAALLAVKFAGSLKSACVMGLLSGLFAHSFYADVLKRKRRRGVTRRRDAATDAEGQEAADDGSRGS